LTAVETVTAAAVPAGDRIALSDGRTLILSSIEVPRAAPAPTDDDARYTDARPAPPPHSRPHQLSRAGLADQARERLAALVVGGTLSIAFDGPDTDRHDRLVAQVAVTTRGADARVWVQAALLEAGAARVMGTRDRRACLRALLAAEERGRAAARGLWRGDLYGVRPVSAESGETLRPLHALHVVQGTVADAAARGSRVFLNFGEDWRRDFTAGIDARALRLFEAAGLDPLTLGGRRVRLRGWVRDWNGPFLDLSHPEQVEILDTEDISAAPSASGLTSTAGGPAAGGEEDM
jgi:hypothetical protein